jgi:hypothetical protein
VLSSVRVANAVLAPRELESSARAVVVLSLFPNGSPMSHVRYTVAANSFVGKKRLIAAAVVYPDEVAEPSFSYLLHGRSRTAFLYQRGDRVPPAVDASLTEYIRSTAVSWALVTAHPLCPPEAALELAIIRAVEKWVTRQNVLPSLSDTRVLLPTKKPLHDLPVALKQIVNAKDWHTAAARALCRYRASQE